MIFNCPHCNLAIDADDSFASQVIACPSCSKELTVPYVQEAVNPLRMENQGDGYVDETDNELDMKTCPFCAEEIKVQAIKCKHCNSMLDSSLPQDQQPIQQHDSHQQHVQTVTSQQNVEVLPLQQTSIPSVSTDKSRLTMKIESFNWPLLITGVVLFLFSIFIFFSDVGFFAMIILVLIIGGCSLLCVAISIPTPKYTCPVCKVTDVVENLIPAHTCKLCGHMVIIKWIR